MSLRFVRGQTVAQKYLPETRLEGVNWIGFGKVSMLYAVIVGFGRNLGNYMDDGGNTMVDISNGRGNTHGLSL